MKTFVKSIVLIVLVAALVPLYQQTRRVDPAQRDAILEALRELKAIDAEWNVQMLRSKNGLNKHYDPIAKPQGAALQLLDGIVPQLAAYDYTLPHRAQQLRRELVAKIDLIDRFKAENAILRNSVRYVPLAASDLNTKARAAGMTALAMNADLVLVDTLKLETAREADSADAKRTLGGIVRSMVDSRSQYPQAVDESFGTFLSHVIVISVHRDREEEVLEKLGKIPVSEGIDALDSDFKAAFDRKQDTHEKYTLMLHSYAAFLLALFAFLLGRNRRPALRPAMA